MYIKGLSRWRVCKIEISRILELICGTFAVYVDDVVAIVLLLVWIAVGGSCRRNAAYSKAVGEIYSRSLGRSDTQTGDKFFLKNFEMFSCLQHTARVVSLSQPLGQPVHSWWRTGILLISSTCIFSCSIVVFPGRLRSRGLSDSNWIWMEKVLSARCDTSSLREISHYFCKGFIVFVTLTARCPCIHHRWDPLETVRFPVRDLSCRSSNWAAGLRSPWTEASLE